MDAIQPNLNTYLIDPSGATGQQCHAIDILGRHAENKNEIKEILSHGREMGLKPGSFVKIITKDDITPVLKYVGLKFHVIV